MAPRRMSSATSSRRIATTSARKCSRLAYADWERSGDQKFTNGLGPLRRGLCGRADRELLGGKIPFGHEPADHAEIERPVAASLPAGAVAMPMAPQERIDVLCAEAVDSLGHLALEGEPAHFAVGHNVKARGLLQRDGLIDRAILCGLELRVTKTPGYPVVPRFAQRDRPEETADNVGMCRNHRRPGRSDRTKNIVQRGCCPLFAGKSS